MVRYKKELKGAVKFSYGASLGTFIGMGILPYFIFSDIYSDARRIFITGIGCIISFILIVVVSWLNKIAKYKKSIE
jgi:undecaprenyl pyrophosphate phosphatase UppP